MPVRLPGIQPECGPAPRIAHIRETDMDFSLLQRTSKIVDEWRYPAAEPLRNGLLQVDHDPDHRLYWEEYGNPAGEPVIVLHGGPGGACAPVMARYFDPGRYRIVLFDQRGCGKSEPTVASAGPAVALANNATPHLIEDINRLRAALGIEGRMHVFGGSWGSTLAMAYAIAHPHHCANLILRGIFLGAAEDLDFMYQGNAATFEDAPFALTAPGAYVSYPEAWRRFLAPIAPAERGDVMKAYKAIFDRVPSTKQEREQQLAAALAWSIWKAPSPMRSPTSTTAGSSARMCLPCASRRSKRIISPTGCSWNLTISSATLPRWRASRCISSMGGSTWSAR